jgi:CheY-like chemotaxis protein
MSSTKILVFEDDASLREALRSALTKLGAECFVTDKENEAKEILDKNEISILFIDCLLPGLSGVEFVESIRKKYPPELLQVILMSGIFTDSSFVKDSIRSTQAKAFLKKPFEIKDINNLISIRAVTSSIKQEMSPRRALYQIFNKMKTTVRERRKLIESLEEIHGYDLPFLYNLLVESKMSGHLNIVSQSGDVSGISFSQGAIVGVDIADKETFLGKLLIESGYILPDDLNEALNQKSPKKLGEKLIQDNLLSPHAFNIVLSNQMNIRLSRTIINSNLRVNFVETDMEMTSPNIDSDSLLQFLHDWIAGKMTGEWLKSHYTQWINFKLTFGPNYSPDHESINMPIVTALDNLMPRLTSGDSLSKIIDTGMYPEEPFYKALHFLLTKGIVIFSEAVQSVSADEASKMLKKVSAQFQGKNKLEIFDLMVRMTGVEEDDHLGAFNQFINILGDKNQLPTSELKNIYSQIEKQARESYEFCKSGNRDKMREEMTRTEIEIKLKAASQFEEAKNSLQRAQYSVAYQLLLKVLAVDPGTSRYKMYMAWAKLGLIDTKNTQDKKITLKDVEMDMLQLSPEDKFEALYHFVVGLYNKVNKDFTGARKSFEKALAMDPTLIVARRELSKIGTQSSEKKDVLNRDLKDLVSGFFSKKK